VGGKGQKTSKKGFDELGFLRNRGGLRNFDPKMTILAKIEKVPKKAPMAETLGGFRVFWDPLGQKGGFSIFPLQKTAFFEILSKNTKKRRFEGKKVKKTVFFVKTGGQKTAFLWCF
jgi:hypothetical protein